MDSSLFSTAGFRSARSDRSFPIEMRFYYEEGVLNCRLNCPVQYERIFGPMVTALGATRTGDDSSPNRQAASAYYTAPSDDGLRETITRYRKLLAPYLPNGLSPVTYAYVSPPDSLDGIYFEEAPLGHFEVGVKLSYPNEETDDEFMPKWCRATLATGLVTRIVPRSKYASVLTLEPHAQGEGARLQTYEALAVPFKQLITPEQTS
jgi:hypothetical protein